MAKHRFEVPVGTIAAHLEGRKAHEVVRDPSDAIVAGDTAVLVEPHPEGQRELARKVTYVTSASRPCALSDAGLAHGHSILSLVEP